MLYIYSGTYTDIINVEDKIGIGVNGSFNGGNLQVLIERKVTLSKTAGLCFLSLLCKTPDTMQFVAIKEP